MSNKKKMGNIRKKEIFIVLIMILLLLNINFVFAQNEEAEGLAKEAAVGFGKALQIWFTSVKDADTNIPFYDNNKLLIDFLIFFVIFLSIATISMRRVFKGTGNAATGLAITLAAALALAAIKAGMSVTFFIPFVKNILYLLLFIVIFLLFRALGMKSNFWNVVLSLIVTILLFNFGNIIFDKDIGFSARNIVSIPIAAPDEYAKTKLVQAEKLQEKAEGQPPEEANKTLERAAELAEQAAEQATTPGLKEKAEEKAEEIKEPKPKTTEELEEEGYKWYPPAEGYPQGHWEDEEGRILIPDGRIIPFGREEPPPAEEKISGLVWALLIVILILGGGATGRRLGYLGGPNAQQRKLKKITKKQEKAGQFLQELIDIEQRKDEQIAKFGIEQKKDGQIVMKTDGLAYKLGFESEETKKQRETYLRSILDVIKDKYNKANDKEARTFLEQQLKESDDNDMLPGGEESLLSEDNMKAFETPETFREQIRALKNFKKDLKQGVALEVVATQASGAPSTYGTLRNIITHLIKLQKSVKEGVHNIMRLKKDELKLLKECIKDLKKHVEAYEEKGHEPEANKKMLEQFRLMENKVKKTLRDNVKKEKDLKEIYTRIVHIYKEIYSPLDTVIDEFIKIMNDELEAINDIILDKKAGIGPTALKEYIRDQMVPYGKEKKLFDEIRKSRQFEDHLVYIFKEIEKLEEEEIDDMLSKALEIIEAAEEEYSDNRLTEARDHYIEAIKTMRTVFEMAKTRKNTETAKTAEDIAKGCLERVREIRSKLKPATGENVPET